MERSIKLETVVKDMEKTIKEAEGKQFDQIPWIISKVVRITMAQYHLIDTLTKEEYDRCIFVTKQLVEGKSVADIFGILEFYGNFFEVVRDVFYPRLTTEALVTMVKNMIGKSEDLKILDLCTGTGCVAITLSKLLNANTLGLDISTEAISLANKNKQKLNAPKCNFLIMDLMQKWENVLNEKFDIVVSNPPYWTFEKIISKNSAIRNNPLNAFCGGENGLDFHKIIIYNAPKFLKPSGKLFLEMESDQENVLRELLQKNFTHIQTEKDYLGEVRVICGTLKK